MSETKPEKMVSRSVAFALGIVCILLIAGLGGAIAMTINDKDNQINSAKNTINQLNATIADKNNTIASLNVNITNLTNEINPLQTWLDGNKTLLNQTQTWLEGNITYYTSQISDLQSELLSLNSTFSNIVFLADSTVWANNDPISQPAGQYTDWTESADYAGYVSVWVQTSSVAGTHVRVIYSAYGVSFDQEIVVSVNGTAVFPILPSTITVEVGNKNVVSGATETVTITYYY